MLLLAGEGRTMTPGIEIGNYVLAEVLDQGGRGEVWLAYRELEAGGRTAVAIKFPHGEGVLDPRVRDGLDDEARLQMQLQHSNIPRVTDLGLHEGRPYFVMDYIAGRSLAELLARLRDDGTAMRFELVAHIAREVGYALRYAHGFELDGVSRPVLHRDVAPRSVLLSRQGAVYVVGFGVSEAAGIPSSSPAKGTPLYPLYSLYMAPEHALGFPTPKSDGWGLGAIMWEMIEGRPFRGELEADELHRAAKQGRHGPLTREGIPEVLRLVTEGLLCADDRERLTLDEALRQLEAPDLPVQRMALADVLRDCFGDALQRPSRSRTDSETPESVDPPPAAANAKVMRDEGPFGLDAWRLEPEDDGALPPPPAWASMEEPLGSESDPSPSDAPTVEDVQAADVETSRPRSRERAPLGASRGAAEPPMVAVHDLGESSSAVVNKPVVPEDDPEPAPPVAAAAPRKPRSLAMMAAVGLAAVGVGWAVWSRDTVPEARPTPSPADPDVTASATQPVAEATPDDRALAVGPPPLEPAPTVAPAPIPSDVPPVATDTRPVVTDPAPTVPPDAPVAPPPVPTAQPSPEPRPSPPAEPKTGSSPPRKKASGPPVPLSIRLLLFADMELEINGVLFSLGVRKTAAKTTVAPGKVRARWRRPMGKWKSKTFDVEAGTSYEVVLDDRGPAFKALKRK